MLFSAGELVIELARAASSQSGEYKRTTGMIQKLEDAEIIAEGRRRELAGEAMTPQDHSGYSAFPKVAIALKRSRHA